jgi:hypothetical protein
VTLVLSKTHQGTRFDINVIGARVFSLLADSEQEVATLLSTASSLLDMPALTTALATVFAIALHL